MKSLAAPSSQASREANEPRAGARTATFEASEIARYASARRRLRSRLAANGIRDERVLDAMEATPRHLFLSEALRTDAHRNTPLPIGDGQTISAPDVVALMSQALALTGGETVLEIGSGSGYQAAVLARLAARVVSLERIPALARSARETLERLGVTNVEIFQRDGSGGLPEAGPFDAIAVTAAGPRVPAPLVDQLAPGGRLVGPFGSRERQELLRVRKAPSGRIERERIGACRFVDLVGEHGWPPQA